MDLDLDGRAFVVTGGTRGLGFAVAEVLADEGAHVLVASRDPEHVEQASSELGERAAGIAIDLGDDEAPARLVEAAEEAFGRLDGAFVSYGGPVPGEAVDLDDGDLRASVERALVAPIRVVREVVRSLDDGGSVLLLTSSSVEQPIPGLAGSNLTRPGLWGYVKTIADEAGPRGVRVNALVPGRFDTQRVRELEQSIAEREGTTREKVREDNDAMMPLRRVGDPIELGRVAAFLLSPAASYVTGSAWRVDGGMIQGL